MGKLIKNNVGEYNYHFNWMDEEGRSTGFNDVWAPNKPEAIKRAKARETEAHWALYVDRDYVTVPNEVKGEGHCFRMKGMYVNVKTMRRATRELADSMNRLGWMMSN